MSPVTQDILTLICLYAIVTLGLNLVVGFARIFSVNQAALFGVGAFSYAFCVNTLHTSDIFVAWAIGCGVSAVLAAVVALIALRISGDYFIVASFGFQIVLVDAINNWTGLSGGPAGAFGLPFPSFLGATVQTSTQFLYVAAACGVAAFALVAWIARSPFGRLMHAMGADETALAAGGFNVLAIRVQTFVLGGMLAAFAGSLYAAYLGVAQVSDYQYGISISLLAMVIVGGAGSVLGSLLGAALLVLVPQELNTIGVPTSLAGPLQELIFGGILLVVMLFATEGLIRLPGQIPVVRRLSGHLRGRVSQSREDGLARSDDVLAGVGDRARRVGR